MTTISITQLHAETGRWVRAAKHDAIIVTRRGKQVAMLSPRIKEEQPPKPRPVFTGRDWSQLPSTGVDSTVMISEDRDGR